MYVTALAMPMHISTHAGSYRHSFRNLHSTTFIFPQYLTEDSSWSLCFISCMAADAAFQAAASAVSESR